LWSTVKTKEHDRTIQAKKQVRKKYKERTGEGNKKKFLVKPRTFVLFFPICPALPLCPGIKAAHIHVVPRLRMSGNVL
jgi:hypothetical protein